MRNEEALKRWRAFRTYVEQRKRRRRRWRWIRRCWKRTQAGILRAGEIVGKVALAISMFMLMVGVSAIFKTITPFHYAPIYRLSIPFVF